MAKHKQKPKMGIRVRGRAVTYFRDENWSLDEETE
jgi:hypothetical protein